MKREEERKQRCDYLATVRRTKNLSKKKGLRNRWRCKRGSSWFSPNKIKPDGFNMDVFLRSCRKAVISSETPPTVKRQHKKIFLHPATTHWREMPSTRTAETARATPFPPQTHCMSWAAGTKTSTQHLTPEFMHITWEIREIWSTSPGGVSPRKNQHKHLVPAL